MRVPLRAVDLVRLDAGNAVSAATIATLFTGDTLYDSAHGTRREVHLRSGDAVVLCADDQSSVDIIAAFPGCYCASRPAEKFFLFLLDQRRLVRKGGMTAKALEAVQMCAAGLGTFLSEPWGVLAGISDLTKRVSAEVQALVRTPFVFTAAGPSDRPPTVQGTFVMGSEELTNYHGPLVQLHPAAHFQKVRINDPAFLRSQHAGALLQLHLFDTERGDAAEGSSGAAATLCAEGRVEIADKEALLLFLGRAGVNPANLDHAWLDVIDYTSFCSSGTGAF